ncbi:hypothetical protein Aple_019970 [Acrocarpospora pleiomorpha]|uniref:NIF system FeS cluster assembly NifU C-terminal domain-containing protein n=1 Tax=Acrocarpospora pleiomorpha TaxID=90975 RepID=A0A5M3XHG3_9ACTN|nr:hypothetical protein [Acrocarpospora pleiomorpha]GES19101.1 hypothetical protein Aple_019970 [Acrocarpospora pleiomorpha]
MNSLPEAMSRLQGMIGQDYLMRATIVDAASVDVEVVAREEACQECIVPKEFMRDVADDCLSGTGYRVRDLVYPGERAAEPCRR